MTFFEQFHFIRPLWLFALVPLSVLIWMMMKRKLGSRSWEGVCDRTLLPFILIRMQSKSRRLSVLATSLGGILAILALAGPAWQRLPQPVFTPQSALVIAFDLSRSMEATDISPSRVGRTRFKIADILDQRTEGQTGLLVYAGDAFIVTPLTDDTATIKSQLTALAPEIMPVQGNRADIAIERSADLLKQAGAAKGNILLITDEVDLDDRLRAAASAAQRQGYRIFVLGVGTSHGTPVPLADGSFLKDARGEIVIPVLNEKPMRELARIGGGHYNRMSVDDSDIKSLERVFKGVELGDDFNETKLQTDIWKEQGPWLLIALLPLAAVLFRRGYLVVLLIFILPFPHNAAAFDWDSLWLNQQLRAKRALEQGDRKRAAELFTKPEWKGPAQYQTRDYKGALKSLKELKDSESLYNTGNALARLGRYEDAIKAYNQVLKQDPDHEDARYNKKLVEKELQKQKQQNQRQQQNKNQKNSVDNKDQQEGRGQHQNQDRQSQQRQDSRNNDKEQADRRQNQDQQNQQNTNQQDQRDEDKNQRQDANAQAQRREGEEQPERDAEKNMTASRDQKQDEQEQATEQWLRRIPDDPAGLLRRKFLYQYRQRVNRPPPGEKTW